MANAADRRVAPYMSCDGAANGRVQFAHCGGSGVLRRCGDEGGLVVLRRLGREWLQGRNRKKEEREKGKKL